MKRPEVQISSTWNVPWILWMRHFSIVTDYEFSCNENALLIQTPPDDQKAIWKDDKYFISTKNHLNCENFWTGCQDSIVCNSKSIENCLLSSIFDKSAPFPIDFKKATFAIFWSFRTIPPTASCDFHSFGHLVNVAFLDVHRTLSTIIIICISLLIFLNFVLIH